MRDKELIKRTLLDHLSGKIAELNLLQRDLGQSSAHKSSAGDKHETEQAQKHLEQEKLGQQLSILEKYTQVIQQLNTKPTESIQLGSVFELDKQLFYVSVGIGQLIIQEKTIFCLGIQAPIIQSLRGKKQGETITWQGKAMKINLIA